MFITLKWPLPSSIKGVISYSTFNRSRENLKDEKNKNY